MTLFQWAVLGAGVVVIAWLAQIVSSLKDVLYLLKQIDYRISTIQKLPGSL